ncbi:MAG: glycosyltransferase, partial [Paracoccaceae bacterium]
ELIWDAGSISADTVIWHNPSFLKFQKTVATRIVAKHLILVAHENFLRPGKIESFDVQKCLDQIDCASLALKKSIAPISPYNRATILNWFEQNPMSRKWALLKYDWFNICEFPSIAPTARPADRRGRHSRPGFEKFPGLSDMDACFPKHAQSNVILGADTFLNEGLHRPHWKMIPFRGLEVDQFFDMIDFMVYFTSPTLRESFGRVLAEAIAAGKIVISHPETASVFNGAVVSGKPSDVDQIICRFTSDPGLYHAHVVKAQKSIEAFSSKSFKTRFGEVFQTKTGVPA